MARYDVPDVVVILHVTRAEEDHTPKGVQKNHTQRLGRTDQDEDARAGLQTNGGRSHRIRQDVHQRERPADDAETEARNVRQDVLVVGDSRNFRDLLQAPFRLPEQLVHQVAEAFLMRGGKEFL